MAPARRPPRRLTPSVYEVNLFDEVRDTLRSLPPDVVKAVEEFTDQLGTQPWTGEPYRLPDSDLRTAVVADGRLLIIWLVLDDQNRVEVVRAMWLGDSRDG